jgi:hypothetical protein
MISGYRIGGFALDQVGLKAGLLRIELSPRRCREFWRNRNAWGYFVFHSGVVVGTGYRHRSESSNGTEGLI